VFRLPNGTVLAGLILPAVAAGFTGQHRSTIYEQLNAGRGRFRTPAR